MIFYVPGDPTPYRLVKFYFVRVCEKRVECVRGISEDGAETFAHLADVEMQIA